ncbi:MAG: hypothetical protein IKW90_16690 [Lachnospiraceae bacterium]|nr:hypothetical protein [Lachnospiraceae bacterium]
MNCLIAKIKNGSRSITYKKILSGKNIYNSPENLNEAVAYSPNVLLEDGSWYKIDSFSETSYFQEMMKNEFSSVDYDSLEIGEFEMIDYLCSFQEGIYYFQNVSKGNLQPKSWIHIGDRYKYIENGNVININKYADAIYVKEKDTLYFTNLSRITGIFKGISDLYREATEEETAAFLSNEFVTLSDGFDATSVKTANRKRIALAIETLKKFTPDEKKKVFKYIRGYCPDLQFKGNSFSIGNEEQLKQLLWGIEQRYYTTLVGNEKRVANSVMLLGR